MRHLQLSFSCVADGYSIGLTATFANDDDAHAFNESVIAVCKDALEKKNAKISAAISDAGDRTEQSKTETVV